MPEHKLYCVSWNSGGAERKVWMHTWAMSLESARRFSRDVRGSGYRTIITEEAT